jgi:hypothetical protein
VGFLSNHLEKALSEGSNSLAAAGDIIFSAFTFFFMKFSVVSSEIVYPQGRRQYLYPPLSVLQFGADEGYLLGLGVFFKPLVFEL